MEYYRGQYLICLTRLKHSRASNRPFNIKYTVLRCIYMRRTFMMHFLTCHNSPLERKYNNLIKNLLIPSYWDSRYKLKSSITKSGKRSILVKIEWFMLAGHKNMKLLILIRESKFYRKLFKVVKIGMLK